jgi:peptide/nickel transport system permease protein
MLRFLIRRISVIPLALFVVHMLGFSYAHLVRPLRAARNPYLAAISESQPLIPTYAQYLERANRLDFGTMPAPRQLGTGQIPLQEGILRSTTASLGLLGLALLLSIILGAIIGLSSAKTSPPKVARWMSTVSTAGLAMPSFYLGSLFFAAWFIYLLRSGPGSEPPLPFQGFGWDNHLIMPTLVLMARPTVQIAQVTGTLLVEELGKQYIVATRAFGHTWRTIRRKHALRNIFTPIFVTVASALRILVAELIIVEWLFDWPGLGNLLAQTLIPSGTVSTNITPESILFLNPPVVAAVITVFALIFLTADLIASALGRIFDPRLRV